MELLLEELIFLVGVFVGVLDREELSLLLLKLASVDVDLPLDGLVLALVE